MDIGPMALSLTDAVLDATLTLLLFVWVFDAFRDFVKFWG